MKTIVFILEEPSAKVLLQGLVPRLVGPSFATKYLVFEGKQDLEKQLVRRLRGWQTPDSFFVVLRDQDAAECKAVRTRLTELVAESGRSALVRVVCRELEAWVAGDLSAVAEAFELPMIADHVNKEKFRDPDRLIRPIETLRTLIKDYQKVDGARRVGPLLDEHRNRSQSFKAFCDGMRRIVAGEKA
jgi:hypothetical protein